MQLTEHMDDVPHFEAAGFNTSQAQALAGLVGRLNGHFENIIQRLESLEKRMDRMEARMAALPWQMLGLLTAFAALIIAAIKLG